MLTFDQERQQIKISEIDKSLREERDPKLIEHLKDKRMSLKKSRRGI